MEKQAWMCFPRATNSASQRVIARSWETKSHGALSPGPVALFSQLDYGGLTVPFGAPGRCFPQRSHELASAMSESCLPAAGQIFKTS